MCVYDQWTPSILEYGTKSCRPTLEPTGECDIRRQQLRSDLEVQYNDVYQG